MNEYQQAVLARLDRIAVTLDRLLFVQLANHDNRHATIPPKKALAAPTFPGRFSAVAAKGPMMYECLGIRVVRHICFGRDINV